MHTQVQGEKRNEIEPKEIQIHQTNHNIPMQNNGTSSIKHQNIPEQQKQSILHQGIV